MRGTEKLATDFFKKWVERKHGEWKDVSRKGVGYDYVVKWKSGKLEKYEVKGSVHDEGIPDLHSQNFTKRKRLRADYLFVVTAAKKSGRKVWSRIPRRAIRFEDLVDKISYRMRRKAYLLRTYRMK